jgi:hypothetical protein
MRLCCARPILYTNVMDGLFLGTSGPFPWLLGEFLVRPMGGASIVWVAGYDF